jgi:CxxC motif-containing protein (DUF1111 family)
MSVQPLAAASKKEKRKRPHYTKVAAWVAFLLIASSATIVVAQSGPHDKGVRGGTADSGQPLGSVLATQGTPQGPYDFFINGQGRFLDVEVASNSPTNTNNSNIGLGPRFNSNQCASCHLQPAIGGSSPAANPQMQFVDHKNNMQPPFITGDGPTREARFKFFLNRDGSLSNKPDGGVHDLFVISGRGDAGTCAIKQPDFEHNLDLNNVILRIPTPVFGAGLIENIDDATILNNMNSNDAAKDALGISGHVNRNGNDGTMTRFGWKAQNKSLEIFAGEAYNVEMGVTNELFQTERPSPDEARLPDNCKLNPTPEDGSNFAVSPDTAVPSDTVQFAMFMRLLAPPKAVTSFGDVTAASITNGRGVFDAVGCAYCHTPSLKTAESSITDDLNKKDAKLFSDLLVHHMGSNLADGVSQGNAGPDEFRSAPLWGLGQRIFFLHDGRTKDLLDAIQQHASDGSEANGVIHRFNSRNQKDQQDLLNFLRSL